MLSSKEETPQQIYDAYGIDPTKLYSITELCKDIKQILFDQPKLNNTLLRGEITNFSRPASGHIYFSLKDERSMIACAYLKQQQDYAEIDLNNGSQVVALGSVGTYEPRSQYQIYIIRIYPLGKGASFSQLEGLKRKLAEEGLFNTSRKTSISRLPRKIGIVTSRNSAAIEDITNVVNSRFPKMNLVIAPVSVQGDGAPRDIIKGINRVLRVDDVDAVILARGGGPTEDLAPFNDEELVHAISASSKPIITGIGHEEDTTLADLAADFRASTPSTAARAAVPNMEV